MQTRPPRRLHPDLRPTPARATLAAAALMAALASGCAGAQKPKDEVAFPPPPEKARIKFVRAFSGSADLQTSLPRRLWRAISGSRGVQLLNPAGVALSPDGRRLYVTCPPPSSPSVVEFDLVTGSVKTTADTPGAKPKSPWGIAVDGDGNVYVTDQIEKVVWVYSPQRKFVRAIGKERFVRPTGIAVDQRRRLVYVVDGANGSTDRHRVDVFAPDGRYLRTIGTRGSGPGEFNFPTYAAVAPNGNLYVADTGNFRIQVFDPEGAVLTSFGAVGYGPGLFGKVKGMAFDSLGDLYVVDGQVGIVQMFNADHRALMFFGGQLPRNEFMNLPTGIAIDPRTNTIYVADYGFNQVKQYVLVNTTAADLGLQSPTGQGSAKPPAGSGREPSK